MSLSNASSSPIDLIQPAVRGTVGVLQSALNSESVQRIIFTSSCATILEIHPGPPRTFTELDWNKQAVEEVDRLGKDALPVNKYRASKTLAEQGMYYYLLTRANGNHHLMTSCLEIRGGS